MHGAHCISGSVITVGIHVFDRYVLVYRHHTYRAQNFQGMLAWLVGVCPIITLVWYKYMDAW